MEEVYEKRKVGRVLIGGKKIWSLAYVDDMVLLALNREILLDRLDTLRGYTKRLKLIVVKKRIN